MIIVLLQKDQIYLNLLLKNLPENITASISETTDPIRVLNLVSLWKGNCLVVTCHYAGTNLDAHRIADEVKTISPKSQVYAYTVTPPNEPSLLDGIIHKPTNSEDLRYPFKGLSQVLGALLKGSTPSELKKTFPFVT